MAPFMKLYTPLGWTWSLIGFDAMVGKLDVVAQGYVVYPEAALTCELLACSDKAKGCISQS